VINVERIKLIKTNQSFHGHIQALCYLDKLLNGDDLFDAEVSRSQIAKLRKLVSLVLDAPRSDIAVDPYIESTWHQYRRHKTMLHLYMSNLSDADDDVFDLVMNKLSKKNVEEDKDANAVRDDNDLSNLPKVSLLKIFPNVKQLMLTTTNPDGSPIFSFSFLSLLRLIRGSSLSKIVIKAHIPETFWRQYADKSWIDFFWLDDEKREEIIQQYRSCGYHVSFQVEGTGDERERLFVITRHRINS